MLTQIKMVPLYTYAFLVVFKTELLSLVSLERGDSALSYREVSKKIFRQKKFYGLTGVASFKDMQHIGSQNRYILKIASFFQAAANHSCVHQRTLFFIDLESKFHEFFKNAIKRLSFE